MGEWKPEANGPGFKSHSYCLLAVRLCAGCVSGTQCAYASNFSFRGVIRTKCILSCVLNGKHPRNSPRFEHCVSKLEMLLWKAGEPLRVKTLWRNQGTAADLGVLQPGPIPCPVAASWLWTLCDRPPHVPMAIPTSLLWWIISLLRVYKSWNNPFLGCFLSAFWL